MNGNVETGLVKKMSLLRELRHYVRSQTSPRQWQRLKRALEGRKPGERDDIIMISYSPSKFHEIAVVSYREELGTIPRVVLTPLFAERLDGNDGLPDIWRDVLIEVGSRIAEVQAAAAASGSSSVEVSLGGSGRLTDQARDAIENMTDSPQGASVILNGKMVEPQGSLEEYEREKSCHGLLFSSAMRISLRWKEDGDKILALFQKHAGSLALAEPKAWRTAFPGAEAGRSVLGDGWEIGPITDLAEVRTAMAKGRISMPTFNKLAQMLGLTGRDRPATAGIWKDGRVKALFILTRCAGITKAASDGWRVGIHYTPILIELAPDTELWPLMEAAREQVKADILAMAEAVLKSARHCIVDYGAITFAEADKVSLFEEFIEAMADGVDEAEEELPSGAEIGLSIAGAYDDRLVRDAISRVSR